MGGLAKRCPARRWSVGGVRTCEVCSAALVALKTFKALLYVLKLSLRGMGIVSFSFQQR